MTKETKLSDLLHDIKEPTTAAEALEAARKLRAPSDRIRKNAVELEAKVAEERAAACSVLCNIPTVVCYEFEIWFIYRIFAKIHS